MATCIKRDETAYELRTGIREVFFEVKRFNHSLKRIAMCNLTLFCKPPGDDYKHFELIKWVKSARRSFGWLY